jgi:DNA invertase Pin-like site-specific DNA recombinase
MSNNTAALYLRSSKDRSDVSIDAQRRELQNLATAKSLTISAEFADVVVSGKDDNRPAFQRLLAELKAPGRAWSAILMFDTSRLSRNQHVAHVFRHECKKRGVAVHFSMTPDLGGIAGIILPAVLHAMDEVHSFLSREKGLAGMAENVRRGFRAGGRAPSGYVLKHLDTGTLREGKPVTKSKLEPGPAAPKITAYLRDRATGTRRAIAARQAGLARPAAGTLIGIERNALTYAGHTVWNVSHNDTGKRRPRAEWIIQRDTHPALITEAEAKAILERVGEPRGRYCTKAAYLLTGLLITPQGEAWHGDGGKFYRAGKGRRIDAANVDRAVIAKVLADLRATEFIDALVRDAKRRAVHHEPAEVLEAKRAELRKLDERIRRASQAALDAPAPRAFYERLGELEAERAALGRVLEQLEKQNAERAALSTVTARDIEKVLDTLAENIEALDREQLKDFLHELAERITLDPEDLTCRIHYRIPAQAGKLMASPRPANEIPMLRVWRQLKIV